jgi:predicted transcriptional regulator
MAAHRQTFRTLFKQLEAAHEAMTDKFFTAGELSTADLTQQTQNVKQLREQLTNEGINVAMEIRSVLTAEQLAKAAQLKDRMREMHAEMRSLFEEKD